MLREEFLPPEKNGVCRGQNPGGHGQKSIFGDPASGTVSLIGSELHFSFVLPRGDEGLPGAEGAVGPPFAQAIMDALTTLNPGESATGSVSFDGTNVHFTFGIPRGDTGAQGIDGGQGLQGIPGIDGAPGEVTNAALATAISGTSNNTNGVATLDTPFADPDAESMRQRFNDLVLALRR